MANLLRSPTNTSGKVHDITPETAGWEYVGFGLYHLKAGETANEATGDREVILVLVEGHAEIQAAGIDFGKMGDRMSVFEKTAPHCAYVPSDSNWTATATIATTNTAPTQRTTFKRGKRSIHQAMIPKVCTPSWPR